VEAIAELIGAFIVAVGYALMAFVELIGVLVSIIVEFTVIVLTEGLSAATKRYKERKEERNTQTQGEPSTATDTVESKNTTVPFKHVAVIGTVVVVSIVCAVAAMVIQLEIHKGRIEETRTLVARIANSVEEQIRSEQLPAPVSGPLPDHDVWGSPLQLKIDNPLLGTVVVVRSLGPDQQAGSIDDISETRIIRATAAEVGGELAKRGLNKLRERATKLFQRDDSDDNPSSTEEDVRKP
jgi:type II secretory pathway pseudopilin PulG